MNLMGLIFSLLLILSYGYYAMWGKHVAGGKLRNAYVAHQKANRNMLNQFESALYNDLPSLPEERAPKKIGKKIQEKIEKKVIEPNRECAQLNLWSLIHEGKEGQPRLYEFTAKLLRTFYEPLLAKEKRREYRLLDALIASAKKIDPKELFLEKLVLADPELQTLYYKMLKGTKQWDLLKKVGYPPLLDYVKVASSEDKICLFHSHPDMIAVLFNPTIAKGLYDGIHSKEKAPLTRERLEKLALDQHIIRIDPDLFEVTEISGYLSHKEKRKIFAADNKGVFLRKTLKVH